MLSFLLKHWGDNHTLSETNNTGNFWEHFVNFLVLWTPCPRWFHSTMYNINHLCLYPSLPHILSLSVQVNFCMNCIPLKTESKSSVSFISCMESTRGIYDPCVVVLCTGDNGEARGDILWSDVTESVRNKVCLYICWAPAKTKHYCCIADIYFWEKSRLPWIKVFLGKHKGIKQYDFNWTEP